jgi:carboxymethylenebutenolidase
MGKRLAESGYSVLVVNPYYRTVKGNAVPEGSTFGTPSVREALMPHARSLSPETCVTDGRAFVKYLDAQPSVDTNRMIGTTGYCMTGSYTMRLAADMPDRIGAGGSFHGGGLATDNESSPHLLVPKMKAGFLIAIAENDDEKDPNSKVLLREAYDAAGVSAEIEVYEGTLHGWCPPDSRAYNEEQAELHGVACSHCLSVSSHNRKRQTPASGRGLKETEEGDQSLLCDFALFRSSRELPGKTDAGQPSRSAH